MKRTIVYVLFSCLLVNLSQSCSNFTHRNVNFNATNFEYVLQWSKDNIPSDVSFNVQYTRYGEYGWSSVPECQNITNTYCNLSNIITGDEEDFMKHQYIARVQASSRNCTSDWVMSKRLNPRDDTFLVLPKLSYIENVSSVTILIQTPSLALRSKDNKPMTVEELYRDQNFEYHLSLFHAEKGNIWQKSQKENRFEVSGLSPSTEYNGKVFIMIADKQKSDIQNFVVKTLPDHSMVTLISSLVAIFTVVLGTVMLYLGCKFVRHQAQTPKSLIFEKVKQIQVLTARKEKWSLCTMGFSPSMCPLKKYSDLPQDPSGNGQPIAYASQFQASISNTDSQFLLQDFNLQQTAITTDPLIQYGGLCEDSNVEYRENNSTPSVLHHLTLHHSPLPDQDSRTLNQGNNVDSSIWLWNLKPNIMPGLLSSVVVRGAPGCTEEGTETHPPALLPEVIFPEVPSDPFENNGLECSFPEHASSGYRMQNSTEDSQLSSTNGTFIDEQPYRLQ